MKKNYELVEVKVISLDSEDVIVTSGGMATRGLESIGGVVDFGDLGTQPFTTP